jgi:hypothetical protein
VTLRWKREKPGVYVSKAWRVKGKGSQWQLLWGTGKTVVHYGQSKKECQRVAEERDAAEAAEEAKPAPAERKGELRERREASPYSKDLQSVIASLRLEIGRLTEQISLLASAVEKLSEK